MIAAKKAEEAAQLEALEQAQRDDQRNLHGLNLNPDGGLLENIEVGPIPQYPGRQLDPRGVASILQKRVNQNMTQL